MLEIEFKFPAGRYHATPWNHHVNEGVVEWPPSPWRFLRALIATWHLKSTAEESSRSEEDEARLRSLIATLAGELPLYSLPQGVPSHTRHYMPLYKDSTTKVFDTFLDVGERPLVMHWPTADLAHGERTLLDRLVRRIGYLGRAESWVEGHVRIEPRGEVADVVPLSAANEPADVQDEIVRVLAPALPNEYAAWRTAELERRQRRRLAEKRARAIARGKEPTREKLTAKDRENISASLPETVVDALQLETGDLRKAGWNAPPGSRWVDYRRPPDKINPRPAPSRARRSPRPHHVVARFALTSSVLPLLTEAMAVTDRLRQALISHGGGGNIPVFTGHGADDAPLLGHRHGFFLAEANGRQGRITHATIYAEMGFDERALRALHRLPKIWGHGGHDIQTVLIGTGAPESFAGQDLEAGQCPLLIESDVWISRTPFVPTRHPKTTRGGEHKLDSAGLQIGSPEHDLRRLLRELGRELPEPIRVEPLAGTYLGGKAVHWSAFRTTRPKGGGRRGSNVGYGFRIQFPRPVRGPIALGYGAHFGLGVFVPPVDAFRPVAPRA